MDFPKIPHVNHILGWRNLIEPIPREIFGFWVCGMVHFYAFLYSTTQIFYINQDFHQNPEHSIWNDNNLKNIVEKISGGICPKCPPGCASDCMNHTPHNFPTRITRLSYQPMRNSSRSIFIAVQFKNWYNFRFACSLRNPSRAIFRSGSRTSILFTGPVQSD